MGISDAAIILSWYITYAVIFAVTSIIVTIIGSSGLGSLSGVFQHADPSVLFVFFFAFGMSIMAYCFMISAFFSRAKVTHPNRNDLILNFLNIFACAYILWFSWLVWLEWLPTLLASSATLVCQVHLSPQRAGFVYCLPLHLRWVLKGTKFYRIYFYIFLCL
jgi:hypothetical protein